MLEDDDDAVLAPSLRPPLHDSSAPRDREPALVDADAARVRAFLEERAAARFQGEYASAVSHLAELVNASTARPARLVGVRVEHAPRTRASFLSSILNPYLAPGAPTGLLAPFATPDPADPPGPVDAATLAGVLAAARGASARLHASGVFADVRPRLVRAGGPFARDGDYELVVGVREKGWMFAKTNTEVGNGEATAGATVHVRNVFGGGETLEGNVSTGTKTRRSFQATLAAPLAAADPSLRTHASVALSGLRRDNSSFASASEDAHALRAAVTTSALGRGTHELAYTAALRQVGALTPSASLSMRLAAGPSVKSALSHTWTLDTRDARIGTRAGAYSRLTTELAGGPVLRGDAGFVRAEAEHALGRGVPGTSGMTWSLGVRAGALVPLFGKQTLFPDRFQLGGPASVRMFRANSMGPRDGADALGGDMYWAAGLSVLADVPRRPDWPVKAHVFVNAGRLDARDPGKTVAENVAGLLAQPSVGAGVGLVYKFDWIRVEANVGVPLVAARSDGARKGFQLGVGVDFL